MKIKKKKKKNWDFKRENELYDIPFCVIIEGKWIVLEV